MSQLEAALLAQIRYAGLAEPVTQYRFCPPRLFRFDMAWPERKLALEVDGGTWVAGKHSRGAGYEIDCEKLNLAALAGWRVLRATTNTVRDGRALAIVEEALKQTTALDRLRQIPATEVESLPNDW